MNVGPRQRRAECAAHFVAFAGDPFPRPPHQIEFACRGTCALQEEVDGVPADVLQTAQAAATADGHTGYKLTLKMPCYLPVMQYALDRDLRQTLYKAYATRASEQGAKEFDYSYPVEIISEKTPKTWSERLM